MDLVTHAAPCPYCGEVIEVVVDTSVDDQAYVEDCSVCCRPIDIRVAIDVDGETSVVMSHENEV